MMKSTKVRDRIIEAAHALAGTKPASEISLAELARTSGVSWPTVRRHVGGRAGVPRFLESIGAVSPDAAKHPDTSDQAYDTRSQVLDAAFRTFSEKGYSGATLDDVAAEAGLTKGAIYWHFTGKDDLCMALIEERFRSEAARIPADIQEIFGQGDSERALLTFVAYEIEKAREAEPWRLLGLEFVSRSRNPDLRQRYAELAQNIFDDTVPVAQWLISSGIVSKDLDPKAVAFTWRCLLLGLGLWMTQDPDGVDFEGMGPQLAAILGGGMAPGAPQGQGWPTNREYEKDSDKDLP